MNNGCICCTVRGDLIRILGGLMRWKGTFDGILVETTGLADPAPVAQTFFVESTIFSAPACRSGYRSVSSRRIRSSMAHTASSGLCDR
jgi:G3E family GTPase